MFCSLGQPGSLQVIGGQLKNTNRGQTDAEPGGLVRTEYEVDGADITIGHEVTGLRRLLRVILTWASLELMRTS